MAGLQGILARRKGRGSEAKEEAAGTGAASAGSAFAASSRRAFFADPRHLPRLAPPSALLACLRLRGACRRAPPPCPALLLLSPSASPRPRPAARLPSGVRQLLFARGAEQLSRVARGRGGGVVVVVSHGAGLDEGRAPLSPLLRGEAARRHGPEWKPAARLSEAADGAHAGGGGGGGDRLICSSGGWRNDLFQRARAESGFPLT